MANNNSLSQIRQGAVPLLAAAVTELFPQTQVMQGGATSLGFFCDVAFPFAFQKEFLHLVEEHLRALVKERREIRILEMMPKNAAALLRHRGQERRAEAAENQEGQLISLFQVGEFVDLFEGSACSFKNSDFLTAFKLIQAEPLPADPSVIRIFGTACQDKLALKEFLKKFEDFSFQDHMQLGQELNLFTDAALWHPKGEILREQLQAFWKREHRKQNFEFVTTFSQSLPEAKSSHAALHRSLGVRRLAESFCEYAPQKFNALTGLFESKPCIRDSAHLFYEEQELLEECISSLQFILKIPNIFGFEYEVFLCPTQGKAQVLSKALAHCQIGFITGPESSPLKDEKLEVRVKDALGRRWTLSSLILNLKEKVLVRTSFTSLERLIALLIERYKGEFPFWLAPEQVRVIVVGDSAKEMGRLVHEALLAEGFRTALDVSSEKLSQRMHKALREKVPYAIFVGDREQKSQVLTVRAYGSKTDERMKTEECIQKLHTMNRKTEFEN